MPTLKGGSAIGVPAPPAILKGNGELVTPHIDDAERMQGLDPGWTDLEERLPRFGGGPFNQRRRWVLVGNAVNARVSEWIGQRLANVEAFDGSKGEPLSADQAWPLAAWWDGTRRYSADFGSWPTKPKMPVGLEELVGERGSPLSLRATLGFYKRIQGSSLRTKPGFIDAVARHLDRMQRLAKRPQSLGADTGDEPSQEVDVAA